MEASGGGEQNTAATTGGRSTWAGYGATCGENQCREMRLGCGGPFIGGGTMSLGGGED
jgi:hypothetical protein